MISDMLNFDTNFELSGKEILPSEVEAALKEMKSVKSPGNEKITTELLNACKETSIKYTWKSLYLFHFRSKVICSNAAIIVLPVLLAILQRLPSESSCEESGTNYYQKSVKNSLGSRKTAIPAMPSLYSEYKRKGLLRCKSRSTEQSRDYKKAFDRVKHGTMLNDLKELGIDDKDFRQLNNLYKEQIAAISVNGTISELVQINRGCLIT